MVKAAINRLKLNVERRHKRGGFTVKGIEQEATGKSIPCKLWVYLHSTVQCVVSSPIFVRGHFFWVQFLPLFLPISCRPP
jgi:hypothetical protein